MASKEEPKKIEKVVEGKVVRKPKSPGRKFREIFINENSSSVWEYVLFDVLTPALKDMVADATSSGMERMLFGENHRSRRAPRRGEPRTQYNRYSVSRGDDRPPYPQRQSSVARRTKHNFDDILLATRVEAEEVIERLYDLLSAYGTASVSDLNELLGLTSEYTDDKWGWTDLRPSSVKRTRDGYLLILPKPEPLT
jgi:hypothetical protein